jgi:hypothetical protein
MRAHVKEDSRYVIFDASSVSIIYSSYSTRSHPTLVFTVSITTIRPAEQQLLSLVSKQEDIIIIVVIITETLPRSLFKSKRNGSRTRSGQTR